MSNVLIGLNSAASYGPAKYTYDKTRGPQTTRTAKGTQTQILALELQYIWAGWNTEVVEGPVWTLTATLGTDARASGGTVEGDTPIDTWELSAHAEEKDILSSNIVAVKNLSLADKAFMRDAMDGKEKAQDWDNTSAEKTPSWSGDATQQARADQLLWCIFGGMKSRRVNVPVLKHTMTASRGYQFSSAMSGVDEVYSRAAMGRFNNIPNWVFNNMASDPASNPFYRTDGIQIFTGWLKHYPQIQVSARAKSQIVVEWEYGDWATVQYPTTHT